ncbi:MAG: FAD-dependent oxidoreductase [Chloroflexi bacterium]|nr:FAD-dependent oxidoreductase [Chloroflexota bacterium]
MAREVWEPARRTPVVREAEVVVLGGGPAGIAAAVAAAREGARTLLVERYGFLGGMGTAALVTNFCGLYATVYGESRRVVRGIADELLERLAALDGLNQPQTMGVPVAVQSYDVAAYKCAADDLVLGAGVDLLFHTLAVGAVLDGQRIDALLIESKSGRAAVRGQVFIDCSGDADLAAWAGAPWAKGNAHGFLQLPTLMFRLAGVDTARALAEGLPTLRERMAAAHARGDYQFPRLYPILRPQAHPGEWRANMTQVSRQGAPIDGTNVEDLTFAEIEGRRQVRLYHRYLRAEVPGFEQAYIQEIATQIGIRETRRIQGLYELTRDDVLGARDFPDAIGVNGWPVEVHLPGTVRFEPIPGRGYHGLPYRCLVPRGVDNLLVAGRCLSATPEAQASARVSGPCFAMGQAAGTAAVLALRRGQRPAEIDVAALQARLRAQGAYLGEEPAPAPAH